MSAGPVLDQAGDVVGILSASMEILEGTETYAAWILQAFMFKAGSRVAARRLSRGPHLLDLPDTIIKVIGRDKAASASARQRPFV
jgi:hypothetical protein